VPKGFYERSGGDHRAIGILQAERFRPEAGTASVEEYTRQDPNGQWTTVINTTVDKLPPTVSLGITALSVISL